MRKFISAAAVMLLIIAATGCCAGAKGGVQTGGAYYAVFNELFSDDSALNHEIKYIAVDMSRSKAVDNSDFIAYMANFCDKEGYTLLEDGYDGLVEKGLITELYFEDGVIISFDDVSLSDDKLCTNASKWRSGLGAIGAEYTVEYKDGEWTITNEQGMWIS
jgi:hypothetical protein